MASVLSVIAHGVSAQTPIDKIPKGLAPCEFYGEWKEKLEWSERQHKENRIQFFWVRQNKEGQTGLCNQLKGNPDSCERVSWVARINSKRPDVYGGWTFPDRAQAVYHFEGGVTPGDFCLGK